MKRKNQFSTSNKYWLLILAIICIVLMGLSGFAESGKGPLSWAAGYTIVPMQKGINRVGMWIGDVSENFATLQEIKKENKELKSRLEEMTTENNRLQQNSATLERYQGNARKVAEMWLCGDQKALSNRGRNPTGRHNIASLDEHDLRRSGADSKRKIPYETDGGR